MLSILYGENSFAIAQQKRQIIEHYLLESGNELGLERFDATVEPQSLWQSITAQPFLVASKLVVVTEPSQSSDLAEFLLSKFDAIPETTHLLIVETKLDKRTQYYKSIKKNPAAQEFNQLNEVELTKWLIDSAIQTGLKLTSSQAHLIVQRAGTDQWRLQSELKKLVPLGTVRDVDITDLIDQDPTDTVFNMLDALTTGNKQHAYKLYESLRLQRIEPQIILSMLSWQLQNVSLVAMAGDRNDKQIATGASMNPYVVGKNRSAAKKLNGRALKSAIKFLADAEEASRTGKSDIEETLRILIFKLAKLF